MTEVAEDRRANKKDGGGMNGWIFWGIVVLLVGGFLIWGLAQFNEGSKEVQPIKGSLKSDLAASEAFSASETSEQTRVRLETEKAALDAKLAALDPQNPAAPSSTIEGCITTASCPPTAPAAANQSSPWSAPDPMGTRAGPMAHVPHQDKSIPDFPGGIVRTGVDPANGMKFCFVGGEAFPDQREVAFKKYCGKRKKV